MDIKPSAAAVLDGRTIPAGVAEERLYRKKVATGVPRQAFECALRLAGASAEDIEHVAIGQRTSLFEPEPVARLGLLRQEYGITAPVRAYDHHYCHATSAHFTSGFRDALVVTLDGRRDALSGSVYEARGGRLKRSSTVDSFDPVGNFCSYITALRGFKAERKITGLAAYRQPCTAEMRARSPGVVHLDNTARRQAEPHRLHARGRDASVELRSTPWRSPSTWSVSLWRQVGESPTLQALAPS